MYKKFLRYIFNRTKDIYLNHQDERYVYYHDLICYVSDCTVAITGNFVCNVLIILSSYYFVSRLSKIELNVMSDNAIYVCWQEWVHSKIRSPASYNIFISKI